MKVETKFAELAPKAVGCFCHMAVVGNTGYISGQLPLNPTSMVIDGKNVQEQAVQSLANLLTILEDSGLTKECVAKTTIYLNDITDFAVVNAVYSDFFGEHKPARSCFAVEALPMGALVEIEAIVAI
jgi:2-iminobutanoate/2-iminopropanoate deaminase